MAFSGCWVAVAGLMAFQGPLPPGLDRVVRIRPELPPGTEWLYRGQVSEGFQSGQAEYSRSYRLETRALALGIRQGKPAVAILTQLREKENARTPGATPAATATLQVCAIDELGRLQNPANEARMPLAAHSMEERGMFLEVPPGGITMGDMWETTEPGMPVVRWQAIGRETVQGIPCLKIEGLQATAEWQTPRADRPAWQRTETVWLGLRNGVAARVERTLERREPARDTTTETRVVRYELDSSIQYPAPLLADRTRDIDLAWNLTRSAAPLLRGGGKPDEVGAVLKKLEVMAAAPSASPYRAALTQVRRSLESAQRGDLPPPDIRAITRNSGGNPVAGSLEVGKPAPDFVAPFLKGGEGSANLRTWKDKALLLAFVQPGTPVAEQVILACKEWKTTAGDRLTVIAFAVKADERNIARLTRDTSFRTPVLDGSGLRISYGVESTPRLVLLDSRHQCLGIFDGWGAETRLECGQEITRLLEANSRR